MVDFFGHFHPLLIHLPIGILLFAVLMEYAFPQKNSVSLIRLILFLGAISAVLSAVLGWLLSFSGQYDADLLQKHKWSGICLSVISVLLWGWKLKGQLFSNAKWISHLLFGMMLALLFLAGHFGGSLTHGEDFLSFNSNNSAKYKNPTTKIEPVTDTSKGSVYDKLIIPVLTVKCYTCHNASKKKGDLVMQTYEALLQGGKTGAALKPGDPAHSELIKRILMDVMNEKHMPPRGKKQLSNQETQLLYWWIQNGASQNIPISEVKKNDTLRVFLSNTNEKEIPELHLPPIKKADSIVLVKLQNMQWEVHTISKGSAYIELSAISFPSLNNEQLKSIKGIASNIAWLNLANTQINDQAINVIGECTHLAKLTLSNTNISSASVQTLKKLTALRFLNMVETKLDDEGLKKLCEMPELKIIYCWKSLVTSKGVDECRKRYPGIVINNGDNTNAIKS